MKDENRGYLGKARLEIVVPAASWRDFLRAFSPSHPLKQFLYTTFLSPPNIWALPLDGDSKPFPVVQTGFVEDDGQFSRDGKWIAYRSDKSGRPEIYIQPFPGAGGDLQVSTSGGTQPRWARGGKELFYIAVDGKLTAVPIQIADGRADVGQPVPLFFVHVGNVITDRSTMFLGTACGF